MVSLKTLCLVVNTMMITIITESPGKHYHHHRVGQPDELAIPYHDDQSVFHKLTMGDSVVVWSCIMETQSRQRDEINPIDLIMSPKVVACPIVSRRSASSTSSLAQRASCQTDIARDPISI